MSDSKTNAAGDSASNPVTDQELLEYLFDCHEEPERVERALAASAALRGRLAAVRGTQGLLSAAAKDGAVERLELEEPKPRRPRERRSFPVFRIAAAAAALLVAFAWGGSRLAESKYERLMALDFDVRATGLASSPSGLARSLQITASSRGDAELRPEFSWKAFGEDGRVLAQDAPLPSGTPSFEANVPATLANIERLEVMATRPDVSGADEVTVTVPMASSPPLVHLTSDKPLYRPGETAYLRGVLLGRLSNEPLEGRFRLRVTDPKGAATKTWTVKAEEGVVARAWSLPGDLAGGRYHLELLSGDGSFAYERLALEVRRFQSPLLAKTITMSRRTFAPGEVGTAAVLVERVVGGPAAGAAARASVIVDGEIVWGETATLDERGSAGFSFELPSEVARGEGRFVVRITDGGAVETAVETFAIPLGQLSARVYPEGGALVAGVAGRVYFEVFDGLGRPASASGWVVDREGRRAGEFRTEHLGRGRFELTPEAGADYFLEFEEPASDRSVELPEVVAQGASLRVARDSFGRGESIVVEISGVGFEAGKPWSLGLFCRGRLVADAAGQGLGAGSGPVTVELHPGAEVAGVLRLTLFDGDLQPLAERLVHRQAAQWVSVDLAPSSGRTTPGAHQVLDVTTRDESGRPVAAVVGLTVTDRAVRDEAGVARVGLADQASLFGDVEWDGPGLEERGELLAGAGVDPGEHGRRIDLLLGTRGWRRFAWLDRDACVAVRGDRGKRLLAREGYSDTEGRFGGQSLERAARKTELRAARSASRSADRTLRKCSTLAIFLLALVGLWRVFGAIFRGLELRLSPGQAQGRIAPSVAALILTILVGAGALVAINSQSEWSTFGRDGAVAVDAMAGAPPDGSLVALGYGGDPPPVLASVGAGVPSISGELASALAGLGYGGGDDVIVDSRSAERVRVYAHRAPVTAPVTGPGSRALRRDFTETVYWNALLKTSVDGKAQVEFDVSDRPTTWHIHADAHGGGRVGQGFGSFESTPALRMEARLPVELTQGDRVSIPVALTAEAGDGVPQDGEVQVGAAVDGALGVDGELPPSVALKEGRGRLLVPVIAGAAEAEGGARIALGASLDGFEDRVVQDVRVVPRGFPAAVSKSGLVTGIDGGAAEFALASPESYVEGSQVFSLKLYPSPLADLLDGADGILQLPHGCFEQASATNYPNVLALSYLKATGLSAPAIEARGRSLLERGYGLLTDYECDALGYEWFGQDPGHEVLSAYGLLEFTDMADVYPVDDGMVGRTSEWLLGRRDGRGGFELDPKSLDSFGRAPAQITNAYCTYALAASGVPVSDLRVELDTQAARAAESADPYEVAAAVCALAAAGRDGDAAAGRERLTAMQKEDGRLEGTTSSITRSGGKDLVVETTAFAVMAWLTSGSDLTQVDDALSYLVAQRQGSGRFGSTQATVMALRAMTQYAQLRRTDARAGEVIVYVNGEEARRVAFEDGAMEPIVLDDLAQSFRPGVNRVRIELTGDNSFPWAADLRYFSEVPADSPDAAVGLDVSLDRSRCTEGDSVGLDLEVRNLTPEGQPMTMAIVGLPAGLECDTVILDDLREAGRFDLWERRGREVILYWRDLAPKAVKSVHLDLIARIPGTTTGPASRSYLYYTPDEVRWAAPLKIEVLPAK